MFTVILHDAPYTTERSWNGLRFAEKALDNGTPVCVFLFSDAVYVARKGQCPPDGTPNLEDLLIKLVGKGATVSVCTTCVEARPYQPSGQSGPGETSACTAQPVPALRPGRAGPLVWALDL